MLYCFRYEIFLFEKYLGINQFMISVNSFCQLLHFIQIQQQNEKCSIKQKNSKINRKTPNLNEKGLRRIPMN